MKTRYLYFVALLIIGLDQLSKYLVSAKYTYGLSEPIIRDVFHITPWRNHGGAFGMFQSWAGMLTIISAIVAVVIIVLIRKKSSLPGLSGLALSLQLGGAVGNLIDRVRLHYVIDFIDFRIWPIFNIADVAITAGIILLAWYLIFCENSKSKSPETAANI